MAEFADGSHSRRDVYDYEGFRDYLERTAPGVITRAVRCGTDRDADELRSLVRKAQAEPTARGQAEAWHAALKESRAVLKRLGVPTASDTPRLDAARQRLAAVAATL